jgi:hypothetical protein
MFVGFAKTPSFDENALLYECKVLWIEIVKTIKSLVFKYFDIIVNV